MTATYTKLKSGEWGIRVEGSVREGQSVTVRKKSGETKTEVVTKVVWSGGGVCLCAVSGSGSSYTPKSGRRGGGDMSGTCWECGGAMPGWLADKGEECGNC